MKKIAVLSVVVLLAVALVNLQSRREKHQLVSVKSVPAAVETAEVDSESSGASEASKEDGSIEVETSFSPRIVE